MVVQNNDRLEELKALCRQAKDLRDATDRLCQELARRIERSRARLLPVGRERRRVPRPRAR